MAASNDSQLENMESFPSYNTSLPSHLNITNLTALFNQSLPCATEISRSGPFMKGTIHTTEGLVLTCLYIVLTAITYGIYAVEVVFLLRTFKNDIERRGTTIWILGVFPVFSTAGLVGFLIPRSACICDLAANVFMALCLYAFLLLMMNYMGGAERMGKVIRATGGVTVRLNTMPLCCLCCCCPEYPLNRKVFMRMRALVLQVCIIRPMLMFGMAVLWTNEWYQHGEMDPKSVGMYLNLANIVTTVTGVWGVNICKTAFADILAEFRIKGKVLVVQLVLFTSCLAPIVVGSMVSAGAIECTPLTTARGNGDAVYRGSIIILMFIYSVVAYYLYKRPEDTHQLQVLTQIIEEAKPGDRGSFLLPVIPTFSIEKSVLRDQEKSVPQELQPINEKPNGEHKCDV